MEFFPGLESSGVYTINPSPEDTNAFVSHLKKKRPLSPKVKTLKEISTTSILKSIDRFLTDQQSCPSQTDVTTSPFANTPNQIVQHIFDAVVVDIDVEIDFEPAVVFCFLLQLLNRHITDFDKYKRHRKFKVGLFRHVLQNCPRIQRVEVAEEVWSDFLILPRPRPSSLIPMMAHSWTNLTSLKLNNAPGEEHMEKSDSLLHLISRYLPKLTDLEMTLSLSTLSIESAKHMSLMSKLKNIVFEFIGFAKKPIDTLVHTVGQVPSLEKLSLLNNQGDSKFYSSFVDTYGKLFSKKKLTLKSIWLCADLDNTWPDCLALDVLHIGIDRQRNSNEGSEYKNLLAGRLMVQKLDIKATGTENIYPLVDKFGPAGLTHLSIEVKGHEHQPLDAFRVTAACTSIQDLKIISSLPLAVSSPFKVSATHFEKCESFSVDTVEHFWDVKAEGTQKLDLFKMYLLGSKKFVQQLEVKTAKELECILWALDQEKHTCLDKVEEVKFINLHSFQALDLILKLVLVLVERSPFLQKVLIRRYRLRGSKQAPNWFMNIFQSLGITFYDCDGTFSTQNETDDESEIEDDFGSDEISDGYVEDD